MALVSGAKENIMAVHKIEKENAMAVHESEKFEKHCINRLIYNLSKADKYVHLQLIIKFIYWSK